MVRVKLWGGQLAPSNRELIVAFHNQAKRLASLRSAHAMRVLGHGLDPWRRPYLITECPAGVSLATRFASGQRFADTPEAAVDTAGRFVHQMAAVLSELHAVGRMAGVMSAENVFLVDSPTLYVKLLDVGMPDPCGSGVIARTYPDATLHALEALAPEHAHMEPLDGRADVWPVAVLAYRILTGAHPFVRAGYAETLRAQQSGAFVPPSRHLPGLPPCLGEALDAWFARALSVSPCDRFGDMMAMSDAWPEDEARRSFPELQGEDLGETHFFPHDDSGVWTAETDDDDTPTRLAYALDEDTHPERDARSSGHRRVVTDEMSLPAATTDEETSGITAVVRPQAPADAYGAKAPGPSPAPPTAALAALRRERLAAFAANQQAQRQRTRQALVVALLIVTLLVVVALTR